MNRAIACAGLVLALLLASLCPASAHRAHHHRHHSRHRVTLSLRRSINTPGVVFVSRGTDSVFGQAISEGVPRLIADDRVASEALRWVGSRNMTGHGGPWCKWFVNFVLHRTGYRVNASGRARDAAGLGPRTQPAPGVVGYNGGHTEFVVSVDGNRILSVGGNGKNHRVTEHWRSRGYYAGFVMPQRS